MAGTPILSPGISALPSELITVAAGAQVNVGIYSVADASLPEGVNFKIYRLTPGAHNYVYRLNNSERDRTLFGPASYIVQREAYTGTAFGVFKDV